MQVLPVGHRRCRRAHGCGDSVRGPLSDVELAAESADPGFSRRHPDLSVVGAGWFSGACAVVRLRQSAHRRRDRHLRRRVPEGAGYAAGAGIRAAARRPQTREPEKAVHIRDEQRRWVQERDRSCAAPGEAPARIAACLAAFYRTRSAAIAAALAAAAPTLPPAAPELSARLSDTTVSAAADGQVLLTVEASGRFAIRAESKTGVALQLVDMITGPSDVAGEPGGRDGRLDVLLDKGV